MSRHMSVALSDWEIAEAYARRMQGEKLANLAFWYKVDEKLLRRVFKIYEKRVPR